MKIEVAIADGEPLILDDGVLESEAPPPEAPAVRLAYAAAHVILLDSYRQRSADDDVGEHVDWARTMAFRQHLASHGLGIAEAMDTAQRFELGWPSARRLIQECGALKLPGGFIAGAGADQRPQIDSADPLIEAVLEQIEVIEAAGGIPIVLPMPWLCRWKSDESGFVDAYRAIIEGARGPLFLHWLGPMFLAELEGYFPGDSLERILDLDPSKVRGIKMSMLDDALELEVRQRCRERGQILLTGDDFHFSALIEGDGQAPTGTVKVGDLEVPDGDFSHPLLGVLDGVAPAAGRALGHLAAGDIGAYRRSMAPCEAYGQKVFEAPTESYKVGLAFTAWLNGHQPNRLLINGLEESRDRQHLLEVAQLASKAGCISDAALAASRLQLFLAGEA